ncbi:hypothetical protein KC325_g189 [Hortaea werneckii]|nr:hypothetical protein KC325_g189 [Hortaea werneckii]
MEVLFADSRQWVSTQHLRHRGRFNAFFLRSRLPSLGFLNQPVQLVQARHHITIPVSAGLLLAVRELKLREALMLAMVIDREGRPVFQPP